MTTMTQCRLIRSDGSTQDAFIDSKLAQVGRVVDLKVNGEWDRDWRVERAGVTLTAEMVAQRERDFKKHREATDV